MHCGCGRQLRERLIQESATAAIDPDVASIGSSYHDGDVSGFLFIPQNPGPRDDPWPRLNFRLCDPIEVQAGEMIYIINLREYVEIGQSYYSDPIAEGDGSTWIARREVVSPGWRFIDGNVSWHLRVVQGIPQKQSVPADVVMPLPSVSTEVFDGPAAVLLDPTLTGPAYGGLLPNGNTGSLTTMRNKMYQWTLAAPTPSIRFRVQGPATVVFYASVLQTNPATRPKPTADGQVGGGEIEDVFLRAHPLCQYRHIGGSVVYEKDVLASCVCCRKCNDCCRIAGECSPKSRRDRMRLIRGVT